MANTYASLLIPMFKFYSAFVTITSSNCNLTFRDDTSTDITVAIPTGEYTRTGLAWQCKKQMSASGGGVAVYTVRYRPNTKLYYFASDLSGGATAFQVRVGGANDICATLGITANLTGASSYDGDTTVPSLSTLTLTKNIRGPKVRRSEAREDLILDNGRSESSTFGSVNLLSFYVEHESVASIQGLHDMLREAAGRGQVVRFYPDSTNATDYVDVVFAEKDFDLPEESDLGMYRFYSFACSLREAVSNTGTLDFRSFLDRRPNS